MAALDESELRLDPREGKLDLGIDPEELKVLPPFVALAAALKKRINLMILRRFQPGEVICRQGAPGGTAYYILDRDELPWYQEYFQRASVAVGNGDDEGDKRAASERRAKFAAAFNDIGAVIESWRKDIARLSPAAPPTGESAVPHASVRERLPVMEVFLSLTRERDKRSWVRKLWNGLRFGRVGGATDSLDKPLKIKIDGPRDLPYKSPKDMMFEGELFGEMSCLNRAPRSANVVATRDCYVVEMLPYVLDQLRKDKTFQEMLDKAYRERYLVLHLQEHSLLSHLSPEQLAEVREQVNLDDFEPGEFIYDEHERGHGMHLIRSGIVKVVKNASFLLDPGAILRPDELAGVLRRDPKPSNDLVKDIAGLVPESSRETLAAVLDAENSKLAGALASADADPASPLAPFWDYLPTMVRERARAEALEGKEPADLTTLRDQALRGFLADALNGLIKGDQFRTLPRLRERARAEKIGLRVWQVLADPSKAKPPEVRKCQRYWLTAVYGNVLPPADKIKEGESFWFQSDQIKDWPKAALALAGPDARKHPLKGRVYQLFPEPVCAALDRLLKAAEAAKTDEGSAPKPKGPKGLKGKAAPSPSPEGAPPLAAASPAEAPAPPPVAIAIDPADIALVTDALNNLDLLEDPSLLLPHELLAEASDKKLVEKYLDPFRVFLAGKRAWMPYDTKQAVRATGRLLLEKVLPHDLTAVHKRTDLPRTLAYRSGREFIGEIGLFEGIPRGATCVAYNHPKGDPTRRDAPVRLVHIPRELFQKLLADEAFRAKVAEEVAKRHRRDLEGAAVSPTAGAALRLDTPDGEELGLIQGQSLMVIDLDRCTRCDECVRACVNSHEDGHTRLYLDGPRFGSFLVPSTCRSCMDPVCMAGCPVSSIQRGPLGEMIIRDWCTGCGLCSAQCPYGSIQIHEVVSSPQADTTEEQEKKPKEHAVVCDLCRTLEGGPACVAACPHEAALRINAPIQIAGGRVRL